MTFDPKVYIDFLGTPFLSEDVGCNSCFRSYFLFKDGTSFWWLVVAAKEDCSVWKWNSVGRYILVFPFTIKVAFCVPVYACVTEIGLIGLVRKSSFSKELFPCWKIPISI